MSFISDLLEPIKSWRIIYLRATKAIRSRYARSYFGQVWITLSIAILILCTGLVWTVIWGLPIDEFLPYVAVGHVIYLFVSSIINESASSLINDASYYMSIKSSFFLSIYSLLVRSFIIFLYNVPIIFSVVIWSNSAHFSLSLLYPLHFVIVILFLFFFSYAIAMFCVHFRDFIQLVASTMTVAFLLTPVMWNVKMIPEHLRHYVYINPFAAALELLRNPLIGIPVDYTALFYMCGWLGISILACWIIWKLFNKNAIYWI